MSLNIVTNGVADKVAGLQSNEECVGASAEWSALSSTTKAKYDGKKVIFTDDYESSIKQSVADCIASTSDDDICGASALVDNNTYSTSEKVIGKWIDDDTLYQRTFVKTFTRSSTNESIAICYFPYTDYRVREFNVTAYNKSNGACVSIFVNGATNYFTVVQSTNNNIIAIFGADTWVTNEIEITLTVKYTKH